MEEFDFFQEIFCLFSLLTERLNVSYRQRKDELEQRMSSLQESRRELMVQLEGLMKLLKVMAAARAGSVPPTAACVCPCSLPLHCFSLSNVAVSPLTVPHFFLSILSLSLCFCPG